VYQRGREATGTLGDREPTDQETSTVSKLFPANSSVADIVNVSVVDGKLVLAHRRRIVKGKDGPTLQGTNTPAFPGGGKPIIGPRVYRIPTKAELTAAGVGGKGAAADPPTPTACCSGPPHPGQHRRRAVNHQAAARPPSSTKGVGEHNPDPGGPT
jgi:hypothetical protein